MLNIEWMDENYLYLDITSVLFYLIEIFLDFSM